MKVAWIARNALIGLVSLLPGLTVVLAADKDGKPERLPRHPAISPGEAMPDGWQKLDPLFERLVERLATVEALLDVLDQKRLWNAADKHNQQAQIKRANDATVRMDRNGGGPVRWTKFYGRTIDAFYHPGPSRTAVVLDRRGGVGVAMAQGSPTLKQRPPQFDFIFKAQDKIKADAAKEIDVLVKKRQDLDVYRRQFEAEQIRLWCQIAFHEIERHRLGEKPIYRCEPKSPHVESELAKHVQSMHVTVVFMSRVLKIVAEAQENEARPLQPIALTIKNGRLALADTWRQQGIELIDVTNQEELHYPWDRFVALTIRLEDHAKNVDDSYPRAVKHAQSPAQSNLDDPRQTWEQLAQSLVGFAQVVLAMDEASIALAEQWQVEPDVKTPLVLDVPLPPEPHSPSLDLSRLHLIKIHKPKGKKKQKDPWATHQVSYKEGVAYVQRFDGSTAPLTLQGNSLSWQNPKGRPMKIDVDQKRTDDGMAVELVFDH